MKLLSCQDQQESETMRQELMEAGQIFVIFLYA